MSNLMNKVKDAMGGHHDSTANKQDGLHESHGTTTAGRHGPASYQGGQHPTAPHNSNMGMGMGTQGPGTQLDSQYGSSTLGSGTHATGIHGHQDMGSNTYGPGTGAHGSSNINAGPHQSKLANKLDPRVDSDLDNRGAHAHTTTAATDPMGGHSSNYGALGNSNPGSGTHHDHNTIPHDMGPASNRANPLGHPTGAHVDNRFHEPGFGGAATGGSSYNAPESTKKHTPGPHSSSLLNKLDPRVQSSDHERINTSGNQRGL